jgi:peptide/nickel transport system substrate-binding protein
VGYLQGAGFNYYDDSKTLVQNKIFGSYKIVKNSPTDFRVQYTVNPGRVWSDGTPINGVDLLLSHVLSSNQWAIAAKLGDPDSDAGSAFYSNGYGGTYTDKLVGDPDLSADKMSVTLRWSQRIANWDLYGPGPSPVHALVLMADGKKALQSVANNEAARDRFYAAYKSKDTAFFKALGKAWSNDWNITTVTDSTNPLLFVGNGGFMVTSAVDKSSVTLKVNPKYNSGPALSGKVDTVIFKFISDGTAAAQALANGEIDLYSGQLTADTAAALRKLPGVTTVGGVAATYEHWDTRLAEYPGNDTYDGPFASKYGDKSRDVRKAFLLSIPRQEIVDKLIAPVNPSATVLGSTMTQPGQGIYPQVVKANGSSYYSVGTQAQRNQKAITLLKKWYPNVSSSNPMDITVLVPGNNPRRAAEFALAKANALKVGFNLIGDVQASWSPKIPLTKYDAVFYAYSAGSVSQAGSNANFEFGGSNNRMGLNLPELDAILKTLQVPLSSTRLATQYAAAERIIHSEGISVGVFQFPTVTAFTSTLKGVRPSPLNPNLIWNYWQWAY